MSGHAAAERYAYQGGFVTELLGGAKYDIFFGAFGTGILGVKKLLPNSTLSPNPKDHYIILFVNVQGSGLSVVTSSSTMTTYHNDSLDKDRKVLRWYSQASDRDSVKAQFIIDHATAGSPVVVATRRNAAGSFSLLGIPKQLVMTKEAHLSTAVGDMLLELEDGSDSSDKYHKAISANCLIFPKKVNSIRAIKATEEILTSRRICIRCCVTPAAVDMVFDEMNGDGLAMFEEEDENRRRKLVKKKPANAKADKNLTRVSDKVQKAQKKAEIAAKREAKKAQKAKEDVHLGDAPLGKLVGDTQVRRARGPGSKNVPKAKAKKEKINCARRRLRGRTELLPSEIAALPPLPEGMIDILDAMLIKATSSVCDQVSPAEAASSPMEAPDAASESAGRRRLTELLDAEDSPFEQLPDKMESVATENAEENIEKSDLRHAGEISVEPIGDVVEVIEEPTVAPSDHAGEINGAEKEEVIEERIVDAVASKEDVELNGDAVESKENIVELKEDALESKENIVELKEDIIESNEDVDKAIAKDIEENLEPSPKRAKTD